jgi:hypothetical protein
VNAGYSGTPLAKKLGIKEGHEVATLGAPAHFADLLAPLPASVRVTSGLRGEGVRNVIIVFARTLHELDERFARARARLDPAGGLWVCWPKQTSELAGELRESSVRAQGLATGLVDNKVCAIDSDWSGLRFVVRVRDR